MTNRLLTQSNRLLGFSFRLPRTSRNLPRMQNQAAFVTQSVLIHPRVILLYAVPDELEDPMNPYFHGRGIFRYTQHSTQNTRSRLLNFIVGAPYAVGSMLGEAMKAKLGGLAVFKRALTEMKQLHDAAKIDALESQKWSVAD